MTIEMPPSDLKERGDSSTSAQGIVPHPASNDEISFIDLLIVLAERKHMIFWVTTAFAVLAVIVSLILPNRYTATVTLLTPQQNSPIGAALATQLGSMGGVGALAGSSLGLRSPNEMYVAMLKSRTVEDAMAQRFGLMQEYHQRYLADTRKAFENHATVSATGKDGMIHISIEDRDPNRAAELANGYVDQFRKLSESLAITEASQRRLFFEQQLVSAKDNLANAEEALKKTEQTTGLVQLDSQTRALIETAAGIRAQITSKEVQIESLRTFATNENSQLVQAQQELDSLRAQLAKLGGAEAGGDGGLLMPKGRVPEVGLEFVRKVRDVKYYETIFDILARQFEVAKLDEAKQGAVIQIVDAAVPPERRSFPKRGLIVLGSATAGVIVGIFLALLLAACKTMTNDSDIAPKLNALLRSLSFRGKRASRLQP